MPRATTMVMLALGTCAVIVGVFVFGHDRTEAPIAVETASLPAPVAAPDIRAVAVAAPTRTRAVAPPHIRTVVVNFTSSLDGEVVRGGVTVDAQPEVPRLETDAPDELVLSTLETGTLSLKAGRYSLRAWLYGSEVGAMDVEIPDGDDDPFEITMAIRAIGGLRGTVVGPDGELVANASVTMSSVNRHGVRQQLSQPTRSDATGTFMLPPVNVTPGLEVSIAGEHPEYGRAPDIALVQPDGSVDQQPRLRFSTELSAVFGRVMGVDGRVRSGFDVVIRLATDPRQRWHARTNEAGAFKLRGLAAGSYALDVDRLCLPAGAIPFVILGCATRCDVGDVLTTEPAHLVRLRILDADRRPYSNAMVITGGVFRRSDAEGRVSTPTCSLDPVDVFVNLSVGGSLVTIAAGRFAANGAEHEIVPRYAALRLRLRSRAAPDRPIDEPYVHFAARGNGRETRGQRHVVDGKLVIAESSMSGTWRVELDVRGFAPIAIDVDASDDASRPPLDVWLDHEAP